MFIDIPPVATAVASGEAQMQSPYRCLTFCDFISHMGCVWYDPSDRYAIIFLRKLTECELDDGLFDRLCRCVDEGGSPNDLLRTFHGALHELRLCPGESLEDRLRVLVGSDRPNSVER